MRVKNLSINLGEKWETLTKYQRNKPTECAPKSLNIKEGISRPQSDQTSLGHPWEFQSGIAHLGTQKALRNSI